MGLVEIILLIIVNGAVDCTLVAWFAGRRSKKAIVEWLMTGDKEMQKFVGKLIGMALVAPIATGKKIIDEDGKEEEELLPLYKFLGRELANSMLFKLKAARGGTLSAAKKGLQAELGEPSLLDAFGAGPGKGNTVSWLAEQAAPALINNPQIMEALTQKILDAIGKKGY
jgi:hypothetical protein